MRLHHYIASLGRARRRALEVVLNDRVRQYQAHGKHPQIHGQRVELAVGNHLFSAAFSSLSLSFSFPSSPPFLLLLLLCLYLCSSVFNKHDTQQFLPRDGKSTFCADRPFRPFSSLPQTFRTLSRTEQPAASD